MNKNVRFAAVASVAAVWGIMAFACSGDDENPAAARPDSGLGADSPGSTATGTGTGTAPGAPICGNYGGAAGVATIAANILSAASNDCRISGGFANLKSSDQQHLNECFTIQMQTFFQCPGIDPYTGGTTKDQQGETCRNMQQAHQNLDLRTADVNAFRSLAVAELQKAGLTKDDIAAINNAIIGAQGGVAQANSQNDKNTYCACPNGLYNDASCVPIIDAGSDAYETGTTTDSGSGTDSSIVDSSSSG